MNSWGMHLGPSARRQVLGASGLVVLSGALWVALGWGLDAEDYTNPLRAWRHRALILHGAAAYLLLWTMGRLFALHQQGNWRARHNRASGMALSAALSLLAISGLALYYPPHEDWRDTFSLFHQILGFALALLMPLHIWIGKMDRRQRHEHQKKTRKPAVEHPSP